MATNNIHRSIKWDVKNNKKNSHITWQTCANKADITWQLCAMMTMIVKTICWSNNRNY